MAITVLFEHRLAAEPLLSIILVDWSTREHDYILDYLNQQEADRGLYEILWVEYYGRQFKEIEARIRRSKAAKQPPPLDKWVVMNMPKDIYYHKHLMYNLGLIFSRGKIIVFCDSDACLRPTFVKSIIDSFDRDKDIVLHMDEVRNNHRRFYPFCYPAFDEITGPGCINWLDHKPKGLVNLSDPLHLLNYGACMAAWRKDLIAIGGADEHIDYLGYICGPYEMTFRLINFGRKEIWHQEEWLYHTWHPGQAGRWNYIGPHDGKNMSVTALEVIRSGRVEPLIENPAIRTLRLGNKINISSEAIIAQLIPAEKTLKNWRKAGRPKNIISYLLGNGLMSIRDWLVNKTRGRPVFRKICLLVLRPIYVAKRLMAMLRLSLLLSRMIIKQIYIKCSVPSNGRLRFSKRPGGVGKRFRLFFQLLLAIWNYDRHLIIRCQRCLDHLYAHGTREIIIFASGDITRILYILGQPLSLKIKGIRDDQRGRVFFGFKEKIIMASLVNQRERMKRLKEAGVTEERIVVL